MAMGRCMDPLPAEAFAMGVWSKRLPFKLFHNAPLGLPPGLRVVGVRSDEVECTGWRRAFKNHGKPHTKDCVTAI